MQESHDAVVAGNATAVIDSSIGVDPSLRNELHRIFAPDACVPVHSPGGDEHVGAYGQLVRSQHGLLDHFAGRNRYYWV